MRFMMIIYPGPYAEAGKFPDKKVFDEMGRFNEQMMKSGAMLAGEGLQPSSKGARIRFTGGKPTVTEGPFTDTKNVMGGFWLIRANSKEEAIEWAKRCPVGAGEIIEIRQVYEASDFPAEVFSAEDASREQSMRDELQRRATGP